MEHLKVVNVPKIAGCNGVVEYIIHTADIHIGSSDITLSYDRREEYRRVFDELRKLIDTPLIKGKCMVVIAGDIFHNKKRVSASCIELFNYLMELLKDTPVLIIPGNHDVVMNNHGYSCLIAPLLERSAQSGQIWPNVYYSKNTELVQMCGEIFLHVSVYDQCDRAAMETLTEAVYKQYPNYTLLYHGVVDGIKFGAHVENDTRVSRKSLANCRRAILGDIHEHMAFGKDQHAVYCGSMIQQNRGEGRNKGVVIWNIAKNNYLFKRLMNPYGFLTIDLRPLGDPIGDRYRERLTTMLNEMKAANDPNFEQTYAVTVITDTYGKDGLFIPEIMSIVGKEVNAIKRIQDEETGDNAVVGAAGGDLVANNDLQNIQNIQNIQTTQPSQNAPNTGKPTTISKIEDQLPRNLNKDNHRVILEELLLSRPGVESAKGKLSREMFEYVWDIHAASEIVHKRVRWTIYKLRFSNLFKYGENNVIDFKNMRSVCGVVANNRMGKSSILDVIVLALFNKTLRANRGDAINSHSNSANIMIKFVVNGVMWKLRKEFDRHKQTVKLYKREMAPKSDTDPTLVPKWVDSTGVDANETYEKVRGEIGDLREFLSTCMQVQESYADDIIRMKNTDRKKVLSGLLGLDQLKGVADNAKARLNELNKEVNVITSTMPAEVSADQITALRDEIADITTRIQSHHAKLEDSMRESKEASVRLTSYNQIRELRAKIAKLTRELADKQAELGKLESNMTALTANCARYGIELQNTIDSRYRIDISSVPIAVISAIDAAASRFATFANGANMTTVELAKRCRGIITAKIATLPTTLPTRAVQTIEAELADLIAQRSNAKTNVELTDDISRCNAEINRLNAVIKSETTKKKQPIDTASIQDRINAISNVYKFNDGCDDCKRNRGEYHKRVNMSALIAELERAKANNLQIERDNSEIDNAIKSHSSQISQLMIESTNASTQLGIRARISERMQELVIAREFNGLTATQAANVFKAREPLERIEEGYNRMHYYILARTDSIKLEITQRGNYINMYNEDLRMFNAGTEADNNADIDAVIKYANQMTERCATMQRELIDMMHLLESKKTNVAKLENDIVIRKDLTARLAPINERIIAVTEYIKSLDVKTGLPCRLMQESITALTGRVNDLLREVSDFSVKTRIDDDKIDFYVRERFTDTSKSEAIKKHGLSVELASGYQKFVIMLAYRLSLAATLPCAADFVFIDEGFGCLDSTNAAKIGELLHAVAPNYRFMFIISHIDILHLCLTTPITIRTNPLLGDRSSVVYGNILETPDEDYIIGEPLPIPVAAPLVAQDQQPRAPVVANVVANNVAPVVDAVPNPLIGGVIEGAKVRCECGRLVTRGNLQRHRLTPTHIAQLAARQNPDT